VRSRRLLALIAASGALAASGVHALVPAGYTPRPEYPAKYALVVVVQNYAELPQVDNAFRDGAAIGNGLLTAGYSFVRVIADPPSIDSILNRVDEMLSVARADVQPAVLTVFYAGHGFRTEYANYLVPASARADHLLDDSLPVSTIARRISPNRFTLGIIILDACRTVRTLDDSNSQTPLKNGMPAGFDSFAPNSITVVAMSAGAGQAAESVGASHPEDSPYSWALSVEIPRQSISLDELFDDVRSYVLQDTLNRQQPEESKRAGTSRFFLVPGNEQMGLQEQAWIKVMGSGARRKCLEDYINRYPAGRYLRAAEYLLELAPPQPGEAACTL
jgi:uncharacterized caspase-like protein